MSKAITEAFIVSDKIHEIYSLKEYFLLCHEIRDFCRNNEIAQKTINFFEKKFVEEMEPLSKIAQHFFQESKKVIRIQYVKPGNDPPDGKIFFDNSTICIEFTSSRDLRLLKFAIEETEKGNLTSFTGHRGQDIQGSKHKGYSIPGESVEGELIEDTIQKLNKNIRNVINKKIERNLTNSNWLCVLIDDTTLTPDFNLLMQTLNDIFKDYKQDLSKKQIDRLYFIGFQSWLNYYLI